MNKLTSIKLRLFTLCLATIGMLSVLTSCEQERCKTRGTVCLNGGVCKNGVCSCVPSFEGDSCQFPVNAKFENKYGGYKQIGYRTAAGFDTVYVVPDTFFVYITPGTQDQIQFFSVYTPLLVHHATVRQNELTTTDTIALDDDYHWKGKGSLNGKLMFVDFDRDSLVDGVSFRNYRITMAGSKINP
ncbi:MAG: EGF-like domain [Bacteroidota bacterium]|jgi:hypothetical protein